MFFDNYPANIQKTGNTPVIPRRGLIIFNKKNRRKPSYREVLPSERISTVWLFHQKLTLYEHVLRIEGAVEFFLRHEAHEYNLVKALLKEINVFEEIIFS